MPSQVALWVAFAVLVATMLALDLGLLQKTKRDPTMKQAFAWSAAWLGLASAFGIGITVTRGTSKGLEFFTAYFVEQALSVDNLFVIMLVFAQFGVPRTAQRRVLLWGILGAVILRGAFVFAGAALVERFHFVTYAMGALLIFAAIKLLREIQQTGNDKKEPENEIAPPSRARRLVEKALPISDQLDGQRFTTVRNGVRHATPLLLALVTIEIADAVFAIDSIPAVFGVTTDRLIVFTSNLFAVLGLRSMFFALSGLLDSLVYLKHGLAVVLLLVGAKMVAAVAWTAPSWMTLALVAAVLGIAVLASVVAKKKTAPLYD